MVINFFDAIIQVVDLSNEDEDAPTTHVLNRRKSFVDALPAASAIEASTGSHQTWQYRLSWFQSFGHDDLLRNKCQ